MDFIVSLVYELKMTGNGKTFFEERIIKVSAINESEARKKSAMLAELENEVLETAENGFQIWKFIEIRYIFPLQSIEEGAPFLTRTLGQLEANELTKTNEELIFIE